jgi:hypothetical protein
MILFDAGEKLLIERNQKMAEKTGGWLTGHPPVGSLGLVSVTTIEFESYGPVFRKQTF